MSGLVKAVKKVFKKVAKFVKKHWKVIVIAAAVYFTAGVALAAMPSTAAFSAAMPGFGTGAVFSKAAVAMGFQGAAGSGIAGTLAAQTAAAAGSAATTAAVAGGTVNLPATGAVATTGTVQSAAGSVIGTALPAAAPAAVAPVAATAAPSALASTLSTMNKLAMAKMVVDTAGGLLSDSPDDINRKQHNREYGNAMGIGRDASGTGYKGIVKNAWGDAFSDSGDSPFDENAQTVQNSAAPSAPGAYGNAEESPFGAGQAMTAEAEKQSAQDQQVISSGYRNKNYARV